MEPTTVEDALARVAERPDDHELFQTLGRLYLREGRYAESRAAYERSLALAPDDPWTHLYLGNWCYRRSRLAEALRWFRRAAELLPDEPLVHSCQGDVFRWLGRDDLAEAAYRTAFRSGSTPETPTPAGSWRSGTGSGTVTAGNRSGKPRPGGRTS